jgi:hypothetical protein
MGERSTSLPFRIVKGEPRSLSDSEQIKKSCAIPLK